MRIFTKTMAAAFAATVIAHQATAQDLSGVTSQTSGVEMLAAIEEYWTAERLSAAAPFDLPTLSEAQLLRLLEPDEPTELPPESSLSIESYHPDLAAAVGVPEPANVKERPFWNGGKFFFTADDGKNYWCTAEFTGNNRTVMTAAHCVMNAANGVWHTNFNFRRAYNNGNGQSVGWECMSVWPNWHTSGPQYPYDYAFIYTDTDSGAGWLGFKAGIPYSSWTSIGYPGNYGGGKLMYKVVGTKGTVANQIVQMVGNPMGGGSSGGAWIGDLTTSHVGGNYAIGLNSFGYGSEPNNTYGPLYDQSTYNLLVYVMQKKCMN